MVFDRGDGGGFEAEREERLRERPLGELMGELLQEGRSLLRDEVRLAKAELRAEVGHAAKGGASLGAGGAVLYAALLLLGITLVLVGATFLPAWLAALLVTVIYGIAGAAMLAKGKRELRRFQPARVVENVKEDARWARETMRDVRSSRDANA